MIKYDGFVQKIVYRNPENDFTILYLKENNVSIPVGGYFPGVFKGSHLTVKGEYKTTSRHGYFLSPSTWSTELPTKTYEMIDFLLELVINDYVNDDTESDNPFGQSTIVDKIKYYLTSIVQQYKARTYKVITDDPDSIRRLHPELDHGGQFSKIPFLLIQQIESIQYLRSFTSELVAVNAQLAQYSNRMIAAINERIDLRESGDSLYYLQSNPYIFCELLEDDGFEFPDADDIAKFYGLPMDSYVRCVAGVTYGYREKILSEGHVYAFPDQLLSVASETLSIEHTILSQRIEKMIADGILIRDTFVNEGIYLRQYYRMECDIAEKLMEMNNRNQGNVEINPDYNAINRMLGIELDESQKDAITTAINSPVTIITGGPGTGKTTIIRGLIAALRAEGISSISLAAPTGKAALRMREATGIENAQTIHRLLKITPKSKRKDVRNVSEDVVIIDEFSMVDIDLMDKLIYAMDLHVRLVFVGDVDQLPSVGPGYILHDLIESGRFSVVRLDQVHRQAENSSIVRNARRVLHGEMIEVDYSEDTDLIFEQAESRTEIENAICRIVTSIVENESEDIANIQVLSPVNAGPAGVKSLNLRLQALLNHVDESFMTINDERIKTNDRVMLTRNDYSIEVFNGEISKHCFVDYNTDTNSSSLILVFDENRRAIYQEREAKTKYLTLAYAITVHKSQGSEYRYIIMPIFSGKNLYRNLIYTAMTRARRRLYFVGSREALRNGIDDVRPVERNTKLKERIQNSTVR